MSGWGGVGVKEVCSVKLSEKLSVCNFYTFGKKLIYVLVEVTASDTPNSLLTNM